MGYPGVASPQIPRFLLMCFIFIIACANFTSAAVDTKKLHTICSGKLYPEPGNIYGTGVEDAISNVISNTAKAAYHEYYLKESLGASGFIYAHGQCTETLTEDDCHDCLHEARHQMFDECTHSVGAQTQLMDCRLRYEDYAFNNEG
ncbi:hypothetical protein MLD38_033087 [Melastoma candidum]|uniref:Uncharacterized protein n=1 Tax=Melastoma candidum TaxID=119954 RepID=A0ACB9M5G1_9MYRT|nr:hypothetical protein MLD38_033087 [Melastoma candidum]